MRVGSASFFENQVGALYWPAGIPSTTGIEKPWERVNLGCRENNNFFRSQNKIFDQQRELHSDPLQTGWAVQAPINTTPLYYLSKF